MACRVLLLFLLSLSAFAPTAGAYDFGLTPVASAPIGVGCYDVKTARVSFRLASSEPATLTLYDVRGRVLAREALAAPQPGPGSLALGGGSLKAGVVWMRLEQGGKVATGKGIVLP